MGSPSTDRELVKRGGLAAFFRLAWPVIKPDVPLTWSWHNDLVCAHYEAISRGELRKLVVNVPPGTSKSITTNVMWPAWDWIQHPTRRWIHVAYSETLSQRDAGMVMDLIQSDWYQQRWGADHGGVNIPSSASRGYFENSRGGARLSTMAGGQVLGFHCDFLVADDFNKSDDVRLGGDSARAAMATARTRWVESFSTRRANPKTFARVVIQQRLHENDLSSYCINEDGYVPLVLPMEFEPDRKFSSQWGDDPRTEEGELLVPDRYPAEELIELKRDAQFYACQYQQRPSPAEGLLFQPSFFESRYAEPPRDIYQVVLSVDATLKETASSDFFVVQAWGKRGADFYLLDQTRRRAGFDDGLKIIHAMRRRWNPQAVLVETKANGEAIIETLKRSVPGVVGVNPLGGKDSRANAVLPFFVAGNVHYPTDAVAPWMGLYVAEMVGFPTAKNDDVVDCTSQALLFLSGKVRGRLHEAMAAARRKYGLL